MEIPYSVALRLDSETFMLGYVLLTCAVFNDFSHKPSSSRFTHVNYKREISAFFASNIILAICFYLFKVWCTSPPLIVLFMSHAVAGFPFLKWLCLSLEVTVWSFSVCRNDPYRRETIYVACFIHTHKLAHTQFSKCDLSTFCPAKGFERLLC